VRLDVWNFCQVAFEPARGMQRGRAPVDTCVVHRELRGERHPVGWLRRRRLAAALARRAVELFRRLYVLGFPIRQLTLVDDYGASDDASMAADNSSAFNFRVVAGTDVLSQHALGRAIDLNPVENPWRKPDRIDPPAGAAFADRRDIRPGMIVRPGPIVGVLDELGWEWGGDWRHARDDHHVVWSRPL